MVSEDLDGEATETFSFRMSKALRERLGLEAAGHRRTVGREIVLRLIASFENAASADTDEIQASPVAMAALEKAVAVEANLNDLAARVAILEKRLKKA